MFVIFTANNISCGKVIFSQACVIHSVHVGVFQHAMDKGRVSQHTLGVSARGV